MDIYSNILKPMAKENKISIQNYITWDKGTGFGQMSNLQRSYSIATEKCWFVICGVQGYNNNSDNYFEGFEPIRSYLDAECEKCGGHKIWKQMLGNNMGHHYFTKSQWGFPTKEAYEKMQAFGKEYGAFGKEYEEIKKQYEEIKKQYEEIKREWYSTRAYFDNTHDNMNNVWHFDRTSQEERKDTGGHATPKPIALCSRAIKSSSREDEIILDVFGGSGSTLIASEQLNRKCYMCELSPYYADVIIQRYINLKGSSEDVYLIRDGEKIPYSEINK
jgi:DNA modification methylase